MYISEKVLCAAEIAEKKIKERGIFEKIDALAFANQKKVMEAFSRHQVSDAHFASTTGYGYDDLGRDTFDKVFADSFEAPDALVRHSVVSGTQALCVGLFGLLKTGDTLYSVTGKPYDTLEEIIGINGKNSMGSLADYGIKYRQTELCGGEFDYKNIENVLKEDKSIRVVFLQRSKGYAIRETLSAKKIGELVGFVKKLSDAYVMVDNCYGEFCDEHEPTYYGADLAVGSLIKNPGGGMAESGGYFAGSEKAVELCSYRLTCPGIGRECGASLGNNKSLYKGLFYAPHTVAQAKKTAVFAAALLSELGFDVYPAFDDERHDIIQTVALGSEKALVGFCRGIQSGSPVDSHVLPEPAPMPGYADDIIMAAGAFTQGSSIELSADGPIRPPYTAYLQGGLTYESGKLGILCAATFATEK